MCFSTYQERKLSLESADKVCEMSEESECEILNNATSDHQDCSF